VPVMILAKATACRVRHSARAVDSAAEATEVAVVAMAKAASNINIAMEATHKVPERPGNSVHASFAESVAIGPRTAKQTLQRIWSPLHQNISYREKRRPSEAHLGGTGPSLA
jgi:hypothetical protein